MSGSGILGGIFDTPIHPILVNFTAALIPASVFSDWLGKLLKRQSLTAAAYWMLLYAAIVTPATAFTGWWWNRKMDGTPSDYMPYHFWLGISLAIVLIGMVLWRTIYFRRRQVPGWLYLGAAIVLLAAVVVQGHVGAMIHFLGA